MNPHKFAPLLAAATLITFASSALAFQMSSPDIKPNRTIDNKFVYKGFGCEGENISPELRWSEPLKGTKSYALLVHDPDAPTGGAGWWHWVVYDIPATVTSLPQGAGNSDGSAMVQGARQATTDFGTPGWGGPCPPVGDMPHHYNITLHALKVEKLDLPPNPSASLVGFMVNSNSLGKITLTGVYGRKRR